MTPKATPGPHNVRRSVDGAGDYGKSSAVNTIVISAVAIVVANPLSLCSWLLSISCTTIRYYVLISCRSGQTCYLHWIWSSMMKVRFCLMDCRGWSTTWQDKGLRRGVQSTDSVLVVFDISSMVDFWRFWIGLYSGFMVFLHDEFRAVSARLLIAQPVAKLWSFVLSEPISQNNSSCKLDDLINFWKCPEEQSWYP